MNRPIRILLLLVLTAVVAPATPAAARPDGPIGFAAEVDVLRLGQLAVHADGRIKSFDSHASQTMALVTGPHRIDGQPPAFTYLDMSIRPERYTGRPAIYIKNKPIRREIAEAIRRAASGDADAEAAADEVTATGLMAERRLLDGPVIERLGVLSRDLIRTGKYVQMIETALALSEPRRLLASWRIVPPPDGDPLSPWLSMLEVAAETTGGAVPPAAQAMDPAVRQRLSDAWVRLIVGWRGEDAAAVNAAIAELSGVLPTLGAEVYPPRNRLAWESYYFHMKNFTWVWVIYAFALVPLLLSVVFRWSGARWVGLALFLLAFGLQTFALLLRMYVADRWPNSNMFEAVTTSTWFGGCAAIVLELIARRTPMRSFFALASAAASMVAFMCAHFQPVYLDPNISNRMPVLHDVWLYIHTNVIIFSYCLIFMAAVTAVLYLLYRGIGRVSGFGGPGDFARVGGAGSLIVTTPDGATIIQESRSNLGQVLDGTTMILMELSFIMLWAGLVMGAIWADHSWGRPWGWDPKEVFALNTFIVFAVLIHGRLKVRDKGLWTAAVAIVGAGVMIFNWIAINFVITGLHSYA